MYEINVCFPNDSFLKGAKEKCELVCTVKYQLVRPSALQLRDASEAGCGVWMPPGGYGRRGMSEAGSSSLQV